MKMPKIKAPTLRTREHRLQSYIAKELSSCTYNRVRILFELVNAEMAKRRLKEYSERMKIHDGLKQEKMKIVKP